MPDKSSEKYKEYSELKRFAFFVVNFGYTKEQYLALNEVEKAFIQKEYEEKIVLDSIMNRNAFFNAYTNANRKKGKKFWELFKRKNKSSVKSVDEVEQIKKKINEVDQKDTEKNWVKLIYKNIKKGG